MDDLILGVVGVPTKNCSTTSLKVPNYIKNGCSHCNVLRTVYKRLRRPQREQVLLKSHLTS